MADFVAVRTLHVLADCHIHPGQGITWPRAVLDALAGAELFVTLGDMGERAGLDALAEIAPVIGVRGMDDEEDSRTAIQMRILSAQGMRIGCLFDPATAGLASGKERSLAVSGASMTRVFGEAVDVLLWASTHRPCVDRKRDLLLVNPGSATLPDEGTPPSFAILSLANGIADARIVTI